MLEKTFATFHPSSHTNLQEQYWKRNFHKYDGLITDLGVVEKINSVVVEK